MAIGLTADELMNLFCRYLEARFSKFTGNMEAMAAGESPDMAQMMVDIRQKFPALPPEMLGGIWSILGAFMDTIIANNNALAKVIPHVEP